MLAGRILDSLSHYDLGDVLKADAFPGRFQSLHPLVQSTLYRDEQIDVIDGETRGIVPRGGHRPTAIP